MKKYEIILTVALVAALGIVEVMAHQDQVRVAKKGNKDKGKQQRRPQKPAPKNPKRGDNKKKAPKSKGGNKRGGDVSARGRAVLRRQLPKQA